MATKTTEKKLTPAQIKAKELKEVEGRVKANGKTYKLKGGEAIRLELDTDHYYFLSKIGFVPGVTTILDEAGPVGYGLRNFWKSNTPEESDQILNEASGFGSKLHDAFERLLDGTTLNLLENYPSIREKKCIMTFGDWFKTVKPQNFHSEMVVASFKYKFAGTLDFLGYIKRKDAAEALMMSAAEKKAFIGDEPDKSELWLIDFKTSKQLHFNHELQVGAAYKQAVLESYGLKVERTALLRMPSQHKIGYEFRLIDVAFQDFLNVYNTYLRLHKGEVPQPKEIVAYPEEYQLLMEVEEEETKSAQAPLEMEENRS